jgi:hypothetical protein
MTSRIQRARIPTKSVQNIAFSEDDWKRIEKAYGHSLPSKIRTHITIATEALRVVSAAERHGPALEKIRAKTKKLRIAAMSLLHETGLLVNDNSACTSFEALAEALNTTVKECLNDHLQFMLVVRSVVSACDLMLRKCEEDEGLQEGWMWDAWVQAISELMQHHKLPSAARKDRLLRKPNQLDSQFVRLIKELQERMPEELQRHTYDDALPQAIYRARKSNWWPKLLPPELRERFATDLESP